MLRLKYFLGVLFHKISRFFFSEIFITCCPHCRSYNTDFGFEMQYIEDKKGSVDNMWVDYYCYTCKKQFLASINYTPHKKMIDFTPFP